MISEKIYFLRKKNRGRSWRTGLTFIFIWSLLTIGAAPLFGQEQMSVAGITESIKDVTLSVSVSGKIEKIFLKEGDSTLYALPKNVSALYLGKYGPIPATIEP